MYKTIQVVFFTACSVFATCSIDAQTGGNENLKSLLWNFYKPIEILFVDSLRNGIKDSVPSPDEFLYGNFSRQIDATFLDLHSTDSLVSYIMTAEACKNARLYLQGDNAILFDAMGDKMLSKLADTLTAGIQLGTFDSTNEDVAYLIRRLTDDHYLINVKVSNLRKTWGYIRKGRFGYVFHKLTTTYKSEFLRFMGVLILLALLFSFRKRLGRSISQALSKKIRSLTLLLQPSSFLP